MKRIFSLGILLSLIFSLLGCSRRNVSHIHFYTDWVTDRAATCTENGQQSKTCTCGDTVTEALPMLGHNYTESVTAESTCDRVGITTFTCTNCQHSYVEEQQMKTYTSTELYDLYLNRICQIVTNDKKGNPLSLGSGFVYSADGKIITNHHVIEGASSATVTVDSKDYAVEKVLAYDKDMDIAVLQINATDLQPATLCTREHAVGSAVYAFGSSKGMSSTFSDGMITYAKREQNGVDCIQHDAPISSGNSGGPLINIYGEVIGINTWIVQDSQNLNFAIHLSELDNLVYGQPLTMAEYYDKECDYFGFLRDHIKAEGEYDASDKDYTLTLLNTTYESTVYACLAIYDVTDDEISLMTMALGDDYNNWSSLGIDADLSGEYLWISALDSGTDNYYTLGYLTSATFTDKTTLHHSDTNCLSTEMINYLNGFAPDMIDLSLLALRDELETLGMEMSDLGFPNY